MKKFNLYLLIFLILPAITYIGCDDAGIILPFVAKGKVGFSETNLKTLNPNTDGLYQIWVGIDSAGIRSWGSCGKFNVNSSGSPVDENGNPTVFQFSGDTNRLGLASIMLLTIEKGNPVSPSSQVLMSGTVTVTADSVFSNLDIADANAFGTVGEKLNLGDAGKYIRWSPSTNNTNPSQGIWLCDSNGVSHMPQGLALPENGGWIYQAWLVDKTNNTYRSMGKFYNPSAADDDLAGSCSGHNNGFNAPGQDWIQTGGDCGSEINVVSGNYALLVTIEPSNEIPGTLEASTPSFFRVFYQNIDPTLGIGQLDNLYSIYVTQSLPKARVNITN